MNSSHYEVPNPLRQPRSLPATPRVSLALGAILLGAALPAAAPAEVPVRADSVADSVGVDIHLHNGNTLYGNFPTIKALLTGLGVRHTRDGLIDTTWQPYYQRHVELAQAGIKCIFITNPKEDDALLTSWPSRVPGAIEGFEAPNEYDNRNGPDWATTLNTYVRHLSATIKANPATAAYPIIGPSLIRQADFAITAELAPFVDFVNLHNYYGGRNPGTRGWGSNGYGSIEWNKRLAQAAWGGKPLMTTETGYRNDLALNQSVPELVAGKYVPRAVFEQTLHGVTRTYIYELLDEGGGENKTYGLARIDGTPKPAYVGLKNLLTTLKDPGTAPTLVPLQFTLTGGPGSLHHLLMQKRNGAYFLAFWLEDQNYDVNKQQETPSQPVPITFNSDHVFASAETLAFAPDGTLQTTPVKPGKSITLTATDTVTLLRLR